MAKYFPKFVERFQSSSLARPTNSRHNKELHTNIDVIFHGEMKNTQKKSILKTDRGKKGQITHNIMKIILSTDMVPPTEAKDWNSIFTRLKETATVSLELNRQQSNLSNTKGKRKYF